MFLSENKVRAVRTVDLVNNRSEHQVCSLFIMRVDEQCVCWDKIRDPKFEP